MYYRIKDINLGKSMNDQALRVMAKVSHSAWKLIGSEIPDGHHQ